MSSNKTAILTHDLGFPEASELTIPISDSIALRVYSSTEPHNWKIASLQKGLIFVYNGVERIGEGIGFGVPIIIASNETYFSGSSNVYVHQSQGSTIIRKEYCMDHKARNRFRNIRLENRQMRSILRHLSEVYQLNRHSRFLMLTLKNVPMKIGVGASFVETPSLGKVIVTYNILRDRILVKTDFSYLNKRNSERIFVLNEQGTQFFRRYHDARGKQLIGEQIGAWDQIEADWASIVNAQGNAGFRLDRIKKGILRVGREFQGNSLDWIGLDYELDPRSAVVNYQIEILGA